MAMTTREGLKLYSVEVWDGHTGRHLYDLEVEARTAVEAKQAARALCEPDRWLRNVRCWGPA